MLFVLNMKLGLFFSAEWGKLRGFGIGIVVDVVIAAAVDVVIAVCIAVVVDVVIAVGIVIAVAAGIVIVVTQYFSCVSF